MRKLFKIIGILILAVGIAIALYYYANNESLPTGKQGIEADALATKMLQAINHEAYTTTRFLEWSFRGKHAYKWDKQQHVVEVQWANIKAVLHTKTPEKNELFVDGELTKDEELIQKAIDYFNNDSFWLIAPHKVFEDGIERRLATHNGKKALLITYTIGGSTPGDSYLWILDEDGLPTSYKMWVSIIPVGGMEATWEGWITTKSGTKLPTAHKILSRELDMGDVKGYN